jgi:hypothetical protein
MPPPVLNGTAAHCDPPFGTKRPQVQILSPRLYSRRSEALTRVGEGLSCCQYRSKIPQVPQQIRTFDLLIERAPLAGAALRWDEEAAGQNPVTPTKVPAGHPRRKGLEGALEEAPPGLLCASRVAIGLAFEWISNVIDTSAERRIRMITRGWTSTSTSSVAQVRLAS